MERESCPWPGLSHCCPMLGISSPGGAGSPDARRAPGPDTAEGCLRLAPQQTPGSTSHSCIPLHVSSCARTLTFQHPGPAIPTSAMWVRTASTALGQIPQLLLRSQGPEVCQGFIAILGSRTRDRRRPHSVSAAGVGRCRPRPCPATRSRSRIGPGLSQRELGRATQPGAGCARCCQPGHGARPMGRGWQLERLHSKGGAAGPRASVPPRGCSAICPRAHPHVSGLCLSPCTGGWSPGGAAPGSSPRVPLSSSPHPVEILSPG